MIKLSRAKKIALVIDLFLAVVLVVIDRITKYLAMTRLKEHPAVQIIRGVLELNYLENHGAAFGMLQNQKVFLVMIAVLILVMILYCLVMLPDDRKYRPMHLFLTLLSAGALGNMIDRLRDGYVVDFISFVIIHFPIFNVADIYVTVSAFAMVWLFLFYYKETDLSFLSFRQQRRFREFK